MRETEREEGGRKERGTWRLFSKDQIVRFTERKCLSEEVATLSRTTV